MVVVSWCAAHFGDGGQQKQAAQEFA